MSSTGADSRRQTVVSWTRGQVSSLIQRVATEAYGATVCHKPIPGMATVTRPALDDPLAGLQAAELVQRLAADQLRDQANTARAAGCSWDEIGAALGLATSGGAPSGEAAFLWLVEDHAPAEGRAPSFRSSCTWWRCTTCSERVTDHGPFDPHPTDQEDGHAADCDRHAAALSVYAAGWEA